MKNPQSVRTPAPCSTTIAVLARKKRRRSLRDIRGSLEELLDGRFRIISALIGLSKSLTPAPEAITVYSSIAVYVIVFMDNSSGSGCRERSGLK